MLGRPWCSTHSIFGLKNVCTVKLQMTTCFCTVLRFLGDVSQPARGLLCVLHVVPPLHVASFDSTGFGSSDLPLSTISLLVQAVSLPRPNAPELMLS